MNALIEFLNLWGARCLHSALPMFLQASLLIVVLFLLDLAFERYARAVVRYGLWLLVLVKLLLPPSLALPTGIGYWLDTRKQLPVKQTLPATTVLRFGETIAVQGEPKFSPPSAGPKLGFAAVGLLACIAGSVILLGILISRSRNVARRVAEAAEAPAQLQELLNSCCRQMRMRQTTTLKLAGFAMSPAACGLLRPVILIPEELVNKLSMPSLRAVLLHELAHIKRGDVWVNYLQTLLQIVYWYHPLLWLANAQIRRVREQAVDEMVMVEMGEDAETYPVTLLQVAKTCFVRARLRLRLVGIVESGSALAQRLKRLINRPIPTTSRLTMANVLLCLLAGAALLPMAHGQRNDKMLISATKVDPRQEAQSQNTVDSDSLVSRDLKVDRNFLDYFGERGVEEIDKALKVLNDLPPMSSKALGFDWFLGNTLMNQPRPFLSFEIKLLSLPPSAIPELALGMPISTNEQGHVTWKQTAAELNNLLRNLKQRADIQTLLTPRVTTFSGRNAQVETSDIRLTPDLKLTTTVDLLPDLKGDQIDLTINAAFLESGRIDQLHTRPDGAKADTVFSVNAVGYVNFDLGSTRVTLENDQSAVIYYPTKDLRGQTFLIVVSAKMTEILDATTAPAPTNPP
jgi:beta-lactamase regulating signal transducer with metallopeptidase domain